MSELTYTEMLEKVIERAKKFQKESEYSDWKFESITIDTHYNCVTIKFGKSFYGEWDVDCLDISFEEFNSENGVQLCFDRVKKEQEELYKIECGRRQEEKYNQYLKLKKEFENSADEKEKN